MTETTPHAQSPQPTRPQVLIIGGGFGGVYAARALKRADVDVTLLDRGTSNLFQPLLYQCATGILSEGQITMPLRSLLRRNHNVRVLQGEAVELNSGARCVTAKRLDGSTFEVDYDYLVIAAGMQQSYFGNAEIAKHAPGMKTVDDALTIRRRVLTAFEMAETSNDEAERDEWLTFAVVGGGPTGVEMAGQIRELANRTLKGEFHRIDPSMARVVLLEGGDAPLATFGPTLSQKAAKTLDKLHVETHFGVLVNAVDGRSLTAKDKAGNETHVRTRTTLWTAGVEAVDFLGSAARSLGVGQDRDGRIAVGDDLTVPGHANVYVIGDVMDHGGLPGLAEVAMQGGRFAGHDIRRQVRGGQRSKTFRYIDLGEAAYIARHHAVLKVGPIKLAGFLAWLAWGAIHIAFLAGVRNRFGTLASWLLTLGRNRRGERAISYRDVDTAAFPYADTPKP